MFLNNEQLNVPEMFRYKHFLSPKLIEQYSSYHERYLFVNLPGHPEQNEGSPAKWHALKLSHRREIPHYVRDDVAKVRDDVAKVRDDVVKVRDDVVGSR